MNNAVEVINLSKNFNVCGFIRHKRIVTAALSDVSLAVKTGECVAILGPNAAGKTTLLKILSCLILPDKGEVFIGGHPLSSNEVKTKSLVGLVTGEERSFYWRLTGRQNLEFFAALYGLGKNEFKKRADELFTILQLDPQMQHKRFDSYSSGIKQKFALIRALLHNPELLLLDEPFKSLDYNAAIHLKNFIKDDLVQKQKKTVIFTTHHMDEAIDFCDRFLILHKGKIFAFGTLDELRQKIGTPSARLGEIFLKLTGDG